MPWIPELFSAPVVQQFKDGLQRELETFPFFDGLMAGEDDALTGSFAGVPELHHPARGRIRGVRAFEAFVAETRTWLTSRNVEIEDIEQIHVDGRGAGEVILHLDGENGRVALPVAVVADREPDGRIDELRMSQRRALGHD